MIQVAQAMSPEPNHPAHGAGSRRSAFRAAGVHSARVRWLRRGILVVSAVGILALLAVTLFDPFSKIPGRISISQATLNGSRITMELPKLSGFRADGRPYEVRASSGVQDIKTPSIVELNDIEARVTMSDNAVVRLASAKGVYDSSKDFMRFTQDVRITSEAGYDVRLKTAEMDFKAGTVISRDPVTVATRNITIASDRLSIAQGGNVIVFDGNVQSTLLPGPEAADKPDNKAPAR
jgi:lipopolysaccharide export system protein LptC